MSVTKPDSAVEREHQRAYTNQNQEYCQGWQTWECARGDDAALENYLWVTPWTVNAHVMVAKSVTVLPQGEEGLAIVRVAYGTFYNPATHPVGTATLSIRTSSTKVRMTAMPIQGVGAWGAGDPRVLPTEPDEKTGFYYDWAEDSAPGPTLQHNSIVTVRTAYARSGINWNTIFNAQNKVNGFALPNLGNAAAKTMRLIGAAVPVYYLLGSAYDIVPVNYLMQYSEKPWSTTYAYAQKYKRFVRGLPLIRELQADGNPLATGGYYDNYGEACDNVEDARKVSTTVNRAIDSKIQCYSGLMVDYTTFSHLMGLLTWM